MLKYIRLQSSKYRSKSLYERSYTMGFYCGLLIGIVMTSLLATILIILKIKM